MASSTVKSTCPKDHVCPDLLQISKAFDLRIENILNVYIVGSHAWGTCHKNSDWDLIIVLKKLSALKPLNYHKSNLEAFILSKEQYLEQVNAFSMQVLLTLWLPKECVLLESFDQRSTFRVSKPALVAALDQSRQRDLRIAEKHFSKGDTKQAKKVILHCVRYLEMGTQISNEGIISNYLAANTHRDEILGNYCKEWSEFIVSVKPILDTLWEKLLEQS